MTSKVAELPCGPELTKPKRKNVKEEQRLMNTVLSAQMKADAELRKQQRRAETHQEREYLEHIAAEMALQRAVDYAESLKTDSSLMEAWEREQHLKNLKKLQPDGLASVKDYMQKNIGELPGTARTMKAMSVGFDSRKQSRT